MNEKLNRAVKYMLDILFCAGILVEIMMPFLLKKLFLRHDFLCAYGTDGSKQIILPYYILKLVCIMAAGVFALLILYELRCMMKTVVEGDCFVEKNVLSLRRMGRYAIVIAVFMLISNFTAPTLTALGVMVVFIIAGLFSLVLAGVFERAVRYKQENDLTI
ncbi:MAG: DUF2975 domain-containing protein [Lachnospiraceae bacterium]|nr:DUF2975 domain-containing protein [Lachnospiraceae bacterium]